MGTPEQQAEIFDEIQKGIRCGHCEQKADDIKNGTCKSCDDQFREAMEADAAAERKQWEDVKNQVTELQGEDWWKELIEHLEFEDCYFNPQIVDNKVGQHQEVDGELIKEEWVNQTTNGGFTGDDFAGSIYFKLKNGKYLEFGYSM